MIVTRSRTQEAADLDLVMAQLQGDLSIMRMDRIVLTGPLDGTLHHSHHHIIQERSISVHTAGLWIGDQGMVTINTF